MYNKTSFINETEYAEVSGTGWIMRDLPSYAEGHQLAYAQNYGAHNRIIQRSLDYGRRPASVSRYKVYASIQHFVTLANWLVLLHFLTIKGGVEGFA